MDLQQVMDLAWLHKRKILKEQIAWEAPQSPAITYRYVNRYVLQKININLNILIQPNYFSFSAYF